MVARIIAPFESGRLLDQSELRRKAEINSLITSRRSLAGIRDIDVLAAGEVLFAIERRFLIASIEWDESDEGLT